MIDIQWAHSDIKMIEWIKETTEIYFTKEFQLINIKVMRKKSPLEHYNNTSSRQNSLMSKLVDKTKNKYNICIASNILPKSIY